MVRYQIRINTSMARLYRHEDDYVPTGLSVERGMMFLTSGTVYLPNGFIRHQIDSDDQYNGQWIDDAVCDKMIIEDIVDKVSDKPLKKLYVTRKDPAIYPTNTSRYISHMNIEVGTILYCDDKYQTVVNGVEETRYRIVKTEPNNYTSVIGKWLLVDSKISDPITNNIYEIPTKVSLSNRVYQMPTLAKSSVTLPTTKPVSKTKPKSVRNNSIMVDVTEKDPITGKHVWEEDFFTQSQINYVNASTENINKQTSATEAINNKGNYEVPSADTTVSTTGDYDPNDFNPEDAADQTIASDNASHAAIDYSQVSDDVWKMNEDEVFDYYVYNYTYEGESLMGVKISRMGYVHGLPFQYTGITDRRIGSENFSDDDSDESDAYGRTFAQEILSNTPIVIIAPGLPKFMSAVSQGLMGKIFSSADGETKKQLLTGYSTNFINNDTSLLEDYLASSDGEFDYFSMEVNLTEYFRYVNSFTKLMARNMGLQNREILMAGNSVRCDQIDWGEYNRDVDSTSQVRELLGLDGGVAFVFDPQSSITDSISTSTGDSQLAGLANQGSAAVRELDFIMGAGAGVKLLNETPQEVADSTGKADSIFGRIGSLLDNTFSGLNIRFPEIWQDSSSSKDYSLEMRFIAPYATPFCVWRYVLVPFAHVLALSAPRSQKRVNSYTSPFLIRAFSKGYLNVEMGMVSGMQWKRFGDGDMISDDGIPTQIDISLEIKDLYKTLSISPWFATNLALFFNNTGLIDLLGTLSGVNMNRASLEDRLELYGFAFTDSIKSIPTNFMRHINDRVRNITDRIFRFT